MKKTVIFLLLIGILNANIISAVCWSEKNKEQICKIKADSNKVWIKGQGWVNGFVVVAVTKVKKVTYVLLREEKDEIK